MRSLSPRRTTRPRGQAWLNPDFVLRIDPIFKFSMFRWATRNYVGLRLAIGS